MDDGLYFELVETLKTKHQYDLELLRRVPQKWTKAEREKRGLEQVIPDEMLSE